jgi:hypothetical protein
MNVDSLVLQLTTARLSETVRSRLFTSEMTLMSTVGPMDETRRVSSTFCTEESALLTWKTVLGVKEKVPVPADSKS